MYSPRLEEDLIPKLYHEAKRLKMPMTKLASKIIRQHLDKKGGEQDESPGGVKSNS